MFEIRTRWMHGYPAACLVVILAACGATASPSVLPSASPPASPSESPSVRPSVSSAASPAGPEVTLTDAGCTSTPSDLPPGTARFTIRNDSSSLANFELLRISGTFEEFRDQFLPDESDAAGETPPGELANVEEEIRRLLVEPGATGTLVGGVASGLHAVVCVVLDEHEDIVIAYPVGPYTVTE
jgi:hypothetical protein